MSSRFESHGRGRREQSPHDIIRTAILDAKRRMPVIDDNGMANNFDQIYRDVEARIKQSLNELKRSESYALAALEDHDQAAFAAAEQEALDAEEQAFSIAAELFPAEVTVTEIGWFEGAEVEELNDEQKMDKLLSELDIMAYDITGEMEGNSAHSGSHDVRGSQFRGRSRSRSSFRSIDPDIPSREDIELTFAAEDTAAQGPSTAQKVKTIIEANERARGAVEKMQAIKAKALRAAAEKEGSPASAKTIVLSFAKEGVGIGANMSRIYNIAGEPSVTIRNNASIMDIDPAMNASPDARTVVLCGHGIDTQARDVSKGEITLLDDGNTVVRAESIRFRGERMRSEKKGGMQVGGKGAEFHPDYDPETGMINMKGSSLTKFFKKFSREGNVDSAIFISCYSAERVFETLVQCPDMKYGVGFNGLMPVQAGFDFMETFAMANAIVDNTKLSFYIAANMLHDKYQKAKSKASVAADKERSNRNYEAAQHNDRLTKRYERLRESMSHFVFVERREANEMDRKQFDKRLLELAKQQVKIVGQKTAKACKQFSAWVKKRMHNKPEAWTDTATEEVGKANKRIRRIWGNAQRGHGENIETHNAFVQDFERLMEQISEQQAALEGKKVVAATDEESLAEFGVAATSEYVSNVNPPDIAYPTAYDTEQDYQYAERYIAAHARYIFEQLTELQTRAANMEPDAVQDQLFNLRQQAEQLEPIAHTGYERHDGLETRRTIGRRFLRLVDQVQALYGDIDNFEAAPTTAGEESTIPHPTIEMPGVLLTPEHDAQMLQYLAEHVQYIHALLAELHTRANGMATDALKDELDGLHQQANTLRLHVQNAHKTLEHDDDRSEPFRDIFTNQISPLLGAIKNFSAEGSERKLPSSLITPPDVEFPESFVTKDHGEQALVYVGQHVNYIYELLTELQAHAEGVNEDVLKDRLHELRKQIDELHNICIRGRWRYESGALSELGVRFIDLYGDHVQPLFDTLDRLMNNPAEIARFVAPAPIPDPEPVIDAAVVEANGQLDEIENEMRFLRGSYDGAMHNYAVTAAETVITPEDVTAAWRRFESVREYAVGIRTQLQTIYEAHPTNEAIRQRVRALLDGQVQEVFENAERMMAEAEKLEPRNPEAAVLAELNTIQQQIEALQSGSDFAVGDYEHLRHTEPLDVEEIQFIRKMFVSQKEGALKIQERFNGLYDTHKESQVITSRIADMYDTGLRPIIEKAEEMIAAIDALLQPEAPQSEFEKSLADIQKREKALREREQQRYREWQSKTDLHYNREASRSETLRVLDFADEVQQLINDLRVLGEGLDTTTPQGHKDFQTFLAAWHKLNGFQGEIEELKKSMIRQSNSLQ